MAKQEDINKVVKELDSLRESNPSEFVKRVARLERLMIQHIIEELNTLSVDSDGVVSSEKNVALADKIVESGLAYINKEGMLSATKQLVTGLTKSISQVDKYFRLEFDEIPIKKKFKVALEASQNFIFGLYGDEAIKGVSTNLIKQAIIEGVTTRSSVAQITKNIKAIGGQLPDQTTLGKLHLYAEQTAYDAYSQAERSYTNAVAKAFQAEYYMYLGGTVKDSRPFCITRNGKVYTIAQVEAWASLSDWSGRRLGTDKSTIFVYLGGYRCMHSILPITKGRYERMKQVD